MATASRVQGSNWLSHISKATKDVHGMQGFFGCQHFSKANALLQKEGLPPVDWQIV